MERNMKSGWKRNIISSVCQGVLSPAEILKESILKKKFEKFISKEIWKGFERETLSRAHVLSRSVEPGSATRTLSEGMAAAAAAWAEPFLKRKEFQIMLKKAWMAASAKRVKKKIF